MDTSIRKFYGEVDEYRKKIAQASDDASKLITSSEVALNKLTGDTTTKVADTIESLQAASVKATDDLTATIQTKSREADETLSNLASSTKANITTFQTGVEGSLSEALEQAGTRTNSTRVGSWCWATRLKRSFTFSPTNSGTCGSNTARRRIVASPWAGSRTHGTVRSLHRGESDSQAAGVDGAESGT